MATKRAAAAPKEMGANDQQVDQLVSSFIAKFDPDIADLVRACRTVLRRRFSTAFELVYDNYNALAIGYCASERTSSCIVSIAVYPKSVGLSFYYGAALMDPAGLLQGSGKQNRFIRLPNAATLNNPAVKALIDAAIVNSKTDLPQTGAIRTIIKSVSVKQRPRGSAG